jgi:hypothetical protein
MVDGIGFEPMALSTSKRCSTTELTVLSSYLVNFHNLPHWIQWKAVTVYMLFVSKNCSRREIYWLNLVRTHATQFFCGTQSHFLCGYFRDGFHFRFLGGLDRPDYFKEQHSPGDLLEGRKPCLGDKEYHKTPYSG